MRILMVGISHRTATVQLREQAVIDSTQLEPLTGAFRREYPLSELIVLSTCNRTELYIARPAHAAPTLEQVVEFLARQTQIGIQELQAVSLQRENEEAVTHLFRVATGLDSMVLGEPQILGQVKRAYEQADRLGSVGPILHRIFQQALATAKQLLTSQGLNLGRTSLGSVAVQFAQQVFDRFDDKVIVSLGAGEMAKLAIRHFMALKPAQFWLANRTAQRASTMVEQLKKQPMQGSIHLGIRPFEDLDQLLVEADVLLTSTASQSPVITVDRFRPLLRRRHTRPLFILDMAVPRNVESAIGNLANVYLYNIDDMQSVASANQRDRQDQANRCAQEINRTARQCLAQVRHRDVGQLIKALRERLHELGEQEQQRTLRKLAALPTEDAKEHMPVVLREHTNRLLNKILHLPLSQMDSSKEDAPLGFYAAALRRLFDLQESSIAASGSSLPSSSTKPPPTAAHEPPHKATSDQLPA